MIEKMTLSDYLYQELTAQIRAGRLKYGQSLPTARRLCGWYQVGIRTVRDVMARMQREGYIQTRERRAPAVIYQEKAQAENEQQAVCALLSRRESILQVYETLGTVMPDLFWAGARRCGEEEFRALERVAKRCAHAGVKDSWRLSSAVLHGILAQSRNPLISDLYSSLEIYCQVPVLAGRADPFARVIAEKALFAWVIEPLRQGDRAQAELRIGRMYRGTGREVAAYLEDLSAAFPAVGEDPQAAYRWNAAKGRTHLYAEIARELIDEIGRGRWPDGGYLPSGQALAKRYGVSLYTVRQALQRMEALGFIQVRNGRGAQVTLSRVGGNDRDYFADPAQKRDALIYLQALQLTAMLLRPAARAAFDNMGPESALRMEQELARNGAAAQKALLETVAEALPYRPLQEVFQEVGGLLLWGQHFLFRPSMAVRLPELKRRCAQALERLRSGDREGFVQAAAGSYDASFCWVRSLLCAAGLREAEELRSLEET